MNGLPRMLIGAVAAVALGVVGIAMWLSYFASDADLSPSAEECARAWNVEANHSNQVEASEVGLRYAIVDGWVAKDQYPGCAVTFLDREGGPWLIFGRFMSPEAAPYEWDLVRGERWGSDSPEGPDTTINAMVRPNGTVVLEDTADPG